MTSHASPIVQISTESGEVVNGESKEGLWEGSNFKEVPEVLKSKRISLACGLTSNKGQTLINRSCFVFFCYILYYFVANHRRAAQFEEYVDFVPFSGDLGA